MSPLWELAAAGALVGGCVGLTGMGGGALMTPILVMIFGVDPTAAVGSDLLASMAMKPVGAAVHQRAGSVRWELVRWIVPTAVPAGFAGAFLLHLLGSGAMLQHRVKLAVGAALLLAVVGLMARTLLSRHHRDGPGAHPPEAPLRVRPVRTLLIGLIGGLVVGVTSVGSGSLVIVMLMLTYPGVQAADLVGTDLVQAIPLVGAAALGHLLAGDVRLALAGPLVLGAIPAIYLGAKLSARTPNGVIRWILAVLLLGAGLQLWHVPPAVTLAACTVVAAGAGISVLARLRLRDLPGWHNGGEPFVVWARHAGDAAAVSAGRQAPFNCPCGDEALVPGGDRPSARACRSCARGFKLRHVGKTMALFRWEDVS